MNFVGVSALSKALRKAAAGVPQPPINLQYVSSSFSSVKFTWDENTDNGGAPVLDYLVYWDSGNSFLPVESFALAHETTYLTRIHEQSGLNKGNYYRFWVTARNDAGESQKSTVLLMLTSTVPSKPLSLECTFQDEHVISLAWSEPSIDVGTPVLSYNIESRREDSSDWEVLDQTVDLSYSILSDLETGLAYTLRVQAINEIGASEYSSELVVIAAREPDAPTTFILVHSEPSEIVFEWQEPYDGGSPITYYKVYWDNAAGDNNLQLYAFTVGPTNNLVVYHELTEGLIYSFKVVSVNLVGESGQSLAASFIAAAVPHTPGTPFWTERQPTSVTIEWLAPAENGSAITHYNVY